MSFSVSKSHCLILLYAALLIGPLSSTSAQAESDTQSDKESTLKLLRYGEVGHEKPGLLDANDEIRDLSGHIDDITAETLDSASLAQIRSLDWQDLPVVEGEPRLGVPVNGIGKIVAVGFNYLDHVEETGQEIPKEPVIFMKSTTALSGPNDDVIEPRGASMLDWEVELAIVIGRKAQYVKNEDALDYIAGFTIGNDVSERSYQVYRGGQYVKGKSADTFAPLGPYLLVDEEYDANNLDVWLEVNGENQQKSNTKYLIFDPAFLVSYISEFMTLEPGDVILTGTPGGIGGTQSPPVFLKPGDVMRLGITGLGEQSQTVAPYE
jgi:2,4-diketo-3-deoxy-L-fuconate hydrolase